MNKYTSVKVNKESYVPLINKARVKFLQRYPNLSQVYDYELIEEGLKAFIREGENGRKSKP